jgi:hypothetical protein
VWVEPYLGIIWIAGFFLQPHASVVLIGISVEIAQGFIR